MNCKRGDLVRHRNLSYPHPVSGYPLGLVGMVIKLWPSCSDDPSRELAQVMWLGMNKGRPPFQGRYVIAQNLSVFRGNKEGETNL